MTVRARYQIEQKQVAAMNMTIAITMTVEEWRDFMRAIPGTGYECHHVGALISDALGSVARATDNVFSYPK